MSSKTDWETRRAAAGCTFDVPRAGIATHMLEIARLSVATLYLERIQTYRGHCVLVFDPHHATRIDELSDDEWQHLADDLRRAERAVYRAFRPDHINIASIGQVVPHLHWHIIPRYVNDPRWGGPIWTTTPDEMQKTLLADADYAALVAQVRAELQAAEPR